jgi:hypothetical protein
LNVIHSGQRKPYSKVPIRSARARLPRSPRRPPQGGFSFEAIACIVGYGKSKSDLQDRPSCR